MSDSPFDRGGLASCSDLETPAWRTLFGALEDQQRRFLAHESQFRSPSYRWPRDPLHEWSRCWEYPWAYHQLRVYRQSLGREGLVADMGSGVSFFPFAVAELGYRVVCTDVDPVCETDVARAAACVPVARGSVEGCRLISDGATLPFEDGEADAIYCISVLEHIPSWERTVDEMARVLQPGGLLVLTIDLDLLGNSELGPAAHRHLLARLDERFTRRAEERTVHPRDMLRSDGGPYAFKFPQGLRYQVFRAKQFVKPLLGRTPVLHPGGVLLAVHALALTRR